MANIHQKRLKKAAALAASGQFAKAIPHYLFLVKAHPDQAELWLQLANALGLSGQWEDAKSIHRRMLDTDSRSPELRVRIARDLEDWQDYSGALSIWKQLLSEDLSSRYQTEAMFHEIRLMERLNMLDDALKALGKFEGADSWGWNWLKGLLSRRKGDMDVAKENFEKAFEEAQGEYKVKCAAALARLADEVGDYPSAYRWTNAAVKFRKAEVGKMKKDFPLSDKFADIPENRNETSKTSSIKKPLVFLTGMPRAGTTLLAHKLANLYSVDLSEEYDYIKQLVDNTVFERRIATPDKLVGKLANKKHIAAYWQAQYESGLTDGQLSDKPMLDKNPSLASLTPWLLALFPNMKILWLERDPRDLWISSAMLDVPVNGATCWWQNPSDYGKWCAQHAELRDRLETTLPPEQFIKVDYHDLVSQPEAVMSDIGRKFSLTQNENKSTIKNVVTSPSYEEVIKPIAKDRLARWKNYRPLLTPDDQEAFDRLPESFQYIPR